MPTVGENHSLGFNAYSVLVDNYTNQWLLEKNSYHFIIPYTAHTILPLAGSQMSNLIPAAPPNFTQPAVNTGETALVTYYDTAQPYNPGTSIQALSSIPVTATPTNIAQINGKTIPRPTASIGFSTSSAIGAGATIQFLVVQRGLPGGAAHDFSVNGSSTLTAYIEEVNITIRANSVASLLLIFISSLTAFASGGTVLTAQVYDPIDTLTVSNTPIQTLPTTPATLGHVIREVGFNLGVVAGTTDSSKLIKIPLYRREGDITGRKAPSMPPSSVTNSGWVVGINSSAASTVEAEIDMELSFA